MPRATPVTNATFPLSDGFEMMQSYGKTSAIVKRRWGRLSWRQACLPAGLWTDPHAHHGVYCSMMRIAIAVIAMVLPAFADDTAAFWKATLTRLAGEPLEAT